MGKFISEAGKGYAPRKGFNPTKFDAGYENIADFDQRPPSYKKAELAAWRKRQAAKAK